MLSYHTRVNIDNFLHTSITNKPCPPKRPSISPNRPRGTDKGYLCCSHFYQYILLFLHKKVFNILKWYILSFYMCWNSISKCYRSKMQNLLKTPNVASFWKKDWRPATPRDRWSNCSFYHFVFDEVISVKNSRVIVYVLFTSRQMEKFELVQFQ